MKSLLFLLPPLQVPAPGTNCGVARGWVCLQNGAAQPLVAGLGFRCVTVP